MIKTLAGLITLAVLVAACDSRSATGPFSGAAGPSTATSVITMSPALAVAGSEVTFAGSGLFDHDAYSRVWDFGDGATAEGSPVTHVYQNPGAYDVTLTGNDGVTTRVATMTVSVAPAGTGAVPPPETVRQP